MKLIKRQLIILLLLANCVVLGQSRSFQLSFIEGSSTLDQYLYIQQIGNTRKITLASFDRGSLNQITSFGRISRKDCDSLWSILDNYNFKPEFKKNGFIKYDSIYCFATELPDSLRLAINGDTIRKDLLPWFDYYYDPNTRNYYKLNCTIFMESGTDDGKQATISYRNEEIFKKLRFKDLMIMTEQDRRLVSFLVYILHKYKRCFDKENLYIKGEINRLLK
jgi:hypothetical protein